MIDKDRVGCEVAALHPAIRDELIAHRCVVLTLDASGAIWLTLPRFVPRVAGPVAGCELCHGCGEVVEGEETTKCPRCGGTGG